MKKLNKIDISRAFVYCSDQSKEWTALKLTGGAKLLSPTDRVSTQIFLINFVSGMRNALAIIDRFSGQKTVTTPKGEEHEQ